MIRRSMTRRDSVEVISDVELTDSEVQTLTRKRKIPRSDKPLVGIIYKSKLVRSSETIDDLQWVRMHGFLTGEWLIFSHPVTFMPDSKIHLVQCRIKEHRINGKGAILISDRNSTWVIRFKDRMERRKWLSRMNFNMRQSYLNRSSHQFQPIEQDFTSQLSCSVIESDRESTISTSIPSVAHPKKRKSNIFLKLKQTVLRKSKSFRS